MSFGPLVTALVNELAEQSGEDDLTLVLDDYHLVSSEPVHASLEFLLEHRPPGLHLVLASRSDPPLPLARLRGRGQLTELRATDLRFTFEEAAALLREAVGPGLPDAAAATLAARTEGWAAGLQLAGLSLRGHADASGFVAAFSGSNRYVLDYLADEVLAGQTERVREFLLDTSLLERLSGELCDAVTGHSRSQALLEQVERAGLFLEPLDEVRGWWRYHHLFADLLRARLQQERPGQVVQLHRNAAAWCDEHGLPDDAIRHAVAAGEMVWAARLIEQHFDAVYSLRGEGATLQRWLAALPSEVVRARPRLLVAQAWMVLASGEAGSAEGLLDAAERAPAAAAEEPFEPSVDRSASLLVSVPVRIALLRAYLAELRGDADGAAAFASQALAGVGDNGGCWLLSPGFTWPSPSGCTVGSRRPSVPSPLIGPGGRRLVSPQSPHGAAMNSRRSSTLRGAWMRPSGPASRHWTSPRRRACSPLPAAGPAHVGLAEVAYERNELDAALRHVTEGIALCRQFVYTPPLAGGLATLAWIRQAIGDPAGALEAIGEAAQAAPGPSGLLNLVPSQRARLLLVQGDLAGAARWTSGEGFTADDEPALPQGSRAAGARPGATRPRSARPSARAAGPLARGSGRTGPDRQSHRGRHSAGAGTSGQRRGNRRADGPVPSAYPGLPTGLCAGLRR